MYTYLFSKSSKWEKLHVHMFMPCCIVSLITCMHAIIYMYKYIIQITIISINTHVYTCTYNYNYIERIQTLKVYYSTAPDLSLHLQLFLQQSHKSQEEQVQIHTMK